MYEASNNNSDAVLATELEQLWNQAKPYKQAVKVMIGLLAVGMVLGALLAATTENTAMIVFMLSISSIGAIGWLVTDGIEKRYYKKMYARMQENGLVADACKEFFFVIDYEREEKLSKTIIRRTKLVGKFNRAYGNDYIKGIYDGMPFECADTRLEMHITKGGDEHGNGSSVEKNTVFFGFWLICTISKTISSDITIRENLSNRTKSTVFHERYDIQGEDPVAFNLILPPEVQKEIMQLNDQIGRGLTIRFSGNQAHVLINNMHDNFELNLKSDTLQSIPMLREQFREEASQIGDILAVIRKI